MAMRERTYRCVGGPCDGMLYTMREARQVRLSAHEGVPSSLPDESSVDYDVRRLLAPDGEWHEFLVLTAWTSMQATVWLNRRSPR